LTFYNCKAIKGFRHKGLRLLFEHDEGRKLKADQRDRMRLILSALNAAETVEDMNQPTFRLHPLKGDRKGWWAVTVRANWRVTFRFTQGHAYDVDVEDYH
jgi:proteic killer suppression protein